MPLFDSVTRLKAYLLERCTEELRPAADCSFTFGYIDEGNKKFSVTLEVQLAEALSLVKKGMITLTVDPHLPKANNLIVSTSGKKRKGTVFSFFIQNIIPVFSGCIIRSVLLKKTAGIKASLIPLVKIRKWFKQFIVLCS